MKRRNPAMDGCQCDGCNGLRARYSKDPYMVGFVGAKLLQRGWAGNMDVVEKAYQDSHSSWHEGMSQAASLRAFPLDSRRRKGRSPTHGMGEGLSTLALQGILVD